MSRLGKVKILEKLNELTPILLLYLAVLNEFDFNYLNLPYFSFNFHLISTWFSFNFPFILVFYWSLKKPENLGYGLIFFAGLINDVVVGFPIGISSFSYLFICGFAAYLRNITLRPSILKDWLFFLFTVMVVSSLNYSIVVLFFDLNIGYLDIIINIIFTFFLYIIFANLFEIYQKLTTRSATND